ncbi:MAG: ImmA/IrrE family metallo-endopeptidase [Bacillota bacterium]
MPVERTRIRRRAAESRRQLGFNLLVPVNIWSVLRTAGISVIKKPLKSEISGLFMRKQDVALVLINSARTLGHQNFTAAHEYFHLRYDLELTCRVCSAGNFDPRNAGERDADYFAAYLLAPDEAIEWQIERRTGGLPVDLPDIIALEQYFGISHQAMLIRLVETGHLSEKEKEQWGEGVIEAAKQLGYDTNLYMHTNEEVVLSDYAEKAMFALKRGLISAGRYEELLLEAGYADLVYGEEGET